MSITPSLRRLVFALLSSCTLSTAFVVAPAVLGTTTVAQAQVSAEFESALEPYGQWVRHPRWGMVWVPDDRPYGWRPYTEGRWVYTDEWGWYWVSEGEEQDWGWVTYHYGRWVLDRRMGWVWVPGDEWAPAWVDWRRGGDYVGWAPLPPEEVVYEYDNDPTWWIFVAPRYMSAPRLRTYIVPIHRAPLIIRRTVIVNRTVVVEPRDRRGRIAVNPGVAPNVVAAITHQPVHTFRVAPRVLPVTQGIPGAVQVRPQELGPRGRSAPPGARGTPNPTLRVQVQPTNQVVQPTATVPRPQALPRNERGRLGDRPPLAAQGGQPTQPQPLLRPQPNGQPTPPNGQPKPPPQPGLLSQPPAAHPPAPPPSTRPPPPPQQHAPPPAARPEPPRPPVIQHAPPPARPAPPPAARPAPPPPRQAPPPPAARPAPPPVQHAPPPAARPAPPPARPAPPPAARPAPPPRVPGQPAPPDQNQR